MTPEISENPGPELTRDAFTTHAERRILLHGEEAFAFLRNVGWRGTSNPAGFTFTGDLIKNDDFVVCRYHHNAASFEFEPPKSSLGNKRQMLLAGIGGELDLRAEGSEARLLPGRAMLVDIESFTGATCREQATCLFIVSAGSFSANMSSASGVAPADYLSLLESVIHSLLDSGVSPKDPSFHRVQSAIRELTAALLDRWDSAEGEHPGPASTKQLLARVSEMIDAKAADQSTTVVTIANALGISRSHLARILGAEADSPSAMLRRARVRIARRELARGAEPAEAAAASGFSTVRRMRAALNRP